MAKPFLNASMFGVALGALVLATNAYSQNSPPVAQPTPSTNGASTNTFVSPAQPPAATIIQNSRNLQNTQQRPASTTTVTSPPAKP